MLLSELRVFQDEDKSLAPFDIKGEMAEQTLEQFLLLMFFLGLTQFGRSELHPSSHGILDEQSS